MSEPIELTTAERHAAITASLKATADGWRDHVLLNAILDAINKVRVGDPVGTIRRHCYGNVAVLTDAGWVWIDTNGDTAPSAPLDGSSWPIVFTPEAS